MAYTARDLVTNSFYLSGIVSRELEVVSGEQISEGLSLLNSMLAIKSANLNFIPYFSESTFTAVPNQEKYFIPNLISLETLTFNIGDVRYSLNPDDRIEYWGTSRLDNLSTLTGKYRFERVFNGANLYLYPLPSDSWTFTLWGKFSLSNVTLDQDLSLTLDLFYIEYLRYELAQYMCSEYNVTFQSESTETLRKYREIVNQISTPDLTIRKFSSFSRKNALNWGDVNIGHLWRPF